MGKTCKSCFHFLFFQDHAALEAVVPADAAAELHLDHAWKEIEFVMRDEDFRRGDLEKPRQGADRLARQVHVGGGHQQPDAGAFVAPCDAVILRLLAQRDAMRFGEPFDQPEARVMPRAFVLLARGAEPYD